MNAFLANPNIVNNQLFAHSQSTKDRIQQALDAGYEITIHEAPITQDGWTGAGFSVIDPNTGAGGYLIEGGSNGGSLISEIKPPFIFVAFGAAYDLAVDATTYIADLLECYKQEMIIAISMIAIIILIAAIIPALSAGTATAPIITGILSLTVPGIASAAQKENCYKGCRKANNTHFSLAMPEPITDPELFKKEHQFTPTKLYDICACDDGRILIYNVKLCGRIKDIEPYDTGYYWR